jgi:hypothetical protein
VRPSVVVGSAGSEHENDFESKMPNNRMVNAENHNMI